jgi:hypothetical protein
MINQMAERDPATLLRQMESEQQIEPVSGASLFVRIADTRRAKELDFKPVEDNRNNSTIII